MLGEVGRERAHGRGATSTTHMKKSPSVRSISPTGSPSASNSSGIAGVGNRLGDGKVERDAGRTRVLGEQFAAARVEADRLVGCNGAGLEEHVRARERCVPAQVDLDLGREPPQVETPARARAHERRLRVPHLGRDLLHPRVVAVVEHDRGLVPAERLGRERVDNEDRQAHPPMHPRPPTPNPPNYSQQLAAKTFWGNESPPTVGSFVGVSGLGDDGEDVAGADGVARGDADLLARCPTSRR